MNYAKLARDWIDKRRGPYPDITISPCNSGRGVNHGLVPLKTCTCVECDPAQTGSTRYG